MTGGAATAAGMTFQENVAAWLACLILAESEAPSIVGLPSGVQLSDLLAETINPVDDLKCATSDGGQVFLQCKTTLSLSTNDEAFTSTVDQFVRQWLAGHSANGTVRQLDSGIDRLVLAVSHRCPATIKNDLRELLDRLRSVSATQLDQVVAAFPEITRSQFDVLRALVRSQFESQVGRPATEGDLIALLHLFFVLPLDLQTDGAERRAADDLLRRVLENPTGAQNAWNLLLAAVRTFSPARTGGDLRYFRRLLVDAGLQPRHAHRSDAAIQALKARSAVYERHVKSFASISFSGQEIEIERPAVEQVERLAPDGVLVVGAAGSGKSGCLWEFVERTKRKGAAVLLLAVDQLNASTIGELDSELRLPETTTLVDILADWSGAQNAYLVIDALDAARTNYGLKLICTIISQLRELAPRWKVVASIREFDLRHSLEAQRLFKCSSDSTTASSRFPDVRHVFVSPLSDEELGQLTVQSPPLAALRDRCTEELKELTRNPFNLRLLAEMAETQHDSTQLPEVRTQIELLDLFWKARVESVENYDALDAGLQVFVQALVERRALAAELHGLNLGGISPHAWTKAFASAGLIHAEPMLPGGTKVVSFAHNILFDYAIARLVIKELPDDVIERLARPGSHDLFLAIRPSIVMAFQRVWHASIDRSLFWARSTKFVAHPDVRTFGKVIAGGVAAAEFQTLNDVRTAIELLTTGDRKTVIQLVHYMWQAAFASQQREPNSRMWGSDAPPWIGFAKQLLEAAPDDFAWLIRAFLVKMIPR